MDRFNLVQDFKNDMVNYQERVSSGTQPSFSSFGVLPTTLDFLDNQNISAITIINVAYFGIVYFLYKLMSRKGVEPLKIKNVMRLYNLICVALAGYVVVGVVRHKLVAPGSFACNGMDVSSPTGKKLAFVLWVYYAQKYFEFLDTFFFILRKSWRQVSFLHLYHHSSITFVTAAFIT